MRRNKRVRLVYITICLASAALAIWLSKHYHVARISATIIAILPVIPGTYLAWKAFYADRLEAESSASITDAADLLARLVAHRWDVDARYRRIDEPYSLPISWEPAPDTLVEEWADIVETAANSADSKQRASWALSPYGTIGSGRDIYNVFAERIPTHRLVILGEPGAGKTVLLMQLASYIIARRAPGGAVPVVLPIGSWDPERQDLHTWIINQLVLAYPGINVSSTGRDETFKIAKSLVERGLIIPLLDGLDEMQRNRRIKALSNINDALGPLDRIVISCRTSLYSEATRYAVPRATKLRGAAGVVLKDLRADDVIRYIKRDSGDPAGHARWSAVFSALDTDCVVARTLRNPLMLSLARFIYNPRPGESDDFLPDPANLLNTQKFDDDKALRTHLLRGCVTAAYRKMPQGQEKWGIRDAERTLGVLAKKMTSGLKATQISWWEFSLLAPRGLYSATLAFLDVFAAGLGMAGIAGEQIGIAAAVANSIGVYCYAEFGVQIEKRRKTTNCSLLLAAYLTVVMTAVCTYYYNFLLGLLVGVANGFLGFIGAAILRNRSAVPSAEFRWTPRNLLVGAAFGLFLGLAALAVLISLRHLGPASIIIIAAIVCIAGIAGATAYGLDSAEVDLQSAANPPTLIERDRLIFALFVLITGTLMGVTVAFIGVHGPASIQPRLTSLHRYDGAALYLVSAGAGVAAGMLGGLMKTSWGGFFVAKCYFVVRYGFPFSVIGFIEDARHRGVMRQAGASYQFSHAELQSQLAASTPPRRRFHIDT